MSGNSNWFDEEQALNETTQFSGVHSVQIKEAEHVVTETSEGLKLRVAMLDRIGDDGNPKELTLDTIWLKNTSGRTKDADKVSALFLLLSASPTKFKKYKVQRWSYEAEDYVTEEVNMFADLMLKKCKLYIQMVEDYPRKKVDYNTQEVVDRESDGAWLPDYSKEPRVSFRFNRAFDGSTNQTWSEKKEGKTAAIYKELPSKFPDRKANRQMSEAEILKSIYDQAVKAGKEAELDSDIFTTEVKEHKAPF